MATISCPVSLQSYKNFASEINNENSEPNILRCRVEQGLRIVGELMQPILSRLNNVTSNKTGMVAVDIQSCF